MKNTILILLSLSLIITTACEKEPQLLPEQEPVVITQQINEANPKDLDLKAEIIKHQGQTIENAGFIIQKGRFKYEFRLKPGPDDNYISKRILSSVYRMNKSNTKQKALYGYAYQGFMEVYNKRIYGNAVSFNAPEIAFPKPEYKTDNAALPNTEVSLIGQTLDFMADKQSIYVHGSKAEIISQSYKEIVFLVPDISYSGQTTLEVHFGELIAVLNFEILAPVNHED
jgi:hypothetical protein